MDSSLYRDRHKGEIDRRETLVNRSTTVIASLTTLAGGLGFLVAGFHAPNNLLRVLFWLLVAGAFAALAISSYFIFASYQAPPLLDIGFPSHWQRYYAELETENQGKPGAADAEFENGLTASYVECSERNIQINTERAYRVVNGTKGVLIGYVFALCAAIAYYDAKVPPANAAEASAIAQILEDNVSSICLPTNRVLELATRPKPNPIPGPSPTPPRK